MVLLKLFSRGACWGASFWKWHLVWTLNKEKDLGEFSVHKFVL